MSWLEDMMKNISEALAKEMAKHSNPQLELLEEARKWIGIHEKKGRRSKSVDVFRKAVDGVAEGESWCAAFVQYCCAAVSGRTRSQMTIPPSELCSYIWDKTPIKYRLDKPVPGALVVWNYPGTIKGHIGIVEEVGEQGRILWTIEGNTSDPSEQAPKPGTGVYRKMRTHLSSQNMKLLGYLKPFK